MVDADSAEDGQSSDVERVVKTARRFVEANALFAAVELGVFELLKSSPLYDAEICTRLKLNLNRGRRLLACLRALGFLNATREGRYRNTEVATRCLVEDGETSLVSYITWKSLTARHWHRLPESVRGRQKTIYGKSLYDFLADEGKYQLFHRALDQVESQLTSGIPDFLGRFIGDFDTDLSLVDAGGGSGKVLHAILDRFPRATASLVELDLTAAVSDLEARMDDGRFKYVRGDFLRSDVAEADIVLFVEVLCDHDDHKVTQLLQKARRSLKSSGFVIIVEYLLPDEGNLSTELAVLSMILAAETEGGFRSSSAWKSLLLRTFSRVEMFDMKGNVSRIIVAR